MYKTRWKSGEYWRQPPGIVLLHPVSPNIWTGATAQLISTSPDSSDIPDSPTTSSPLHRVSGNGSGQAGTYPEQATRFETRLTAIEERLAKLCVELRKAVTDSGLAGAAVLASNHQGEFAGWLGLEPVATFVGSDTETVANIDHCLKRAAGRDVRFIIANQQEGTALAQALADRCGAGAVVFSSFPEGCGPGPGFDRLLRDNVRLLCEAVTP